MTSPVWISHRGLSLQCDENSREAFQLACDAGFSWLETDLYCTKDKQIVLHHDPTVGSGSARIAQLTRLELERVQLEKGGRLLFLDEFLVQFSQQQWIFDIKPDTARQTLHILAGLLRQNPSLVKKIVFLFWDKNIQDNFVHDFPGALYFQRESQCYRAGIAAVLGLPLLGNIRKNEIYSIMPEMFGLPCLSKRIVHMFHRREAKVLGYLPGSAAEVQRCLVAGVDYILTNGRPVQLD